MGDCVCEELPVFRLAVFVRFADFFQRTLCVRSSSSAFARPSSTAAAALCPAAQSNGTKDASISGVCSWLDEFFFFKLWTCDFLVVLFGSNIFLLWLRLVFSFNIRRID
jgi:hypothetical protein